jgi:hypothetical protein
VVLAASGFALLGGVAADAAERATEHSAISAVGQPAVHAGSGVNVQAVVALDDWPWNLRPGSVPLDGEASAQVAPAATDDDWPWVIVPLGDDDWPWNVVPMGGDWPWNPGPK